MKRREDLSSVEQLAIVLVASRFGYIPAEWVEERDLVLVFRGLCRSGFMLEANGFYELTVPGTQMAIDVLR